MVTKAFYLTVLVLALTVFASGTSTSESITIAASSPSQNDPSDSTADKFEITQTEKLLGVPLQNFPQPQGPAKFDELPANRPGLRFTVTEQPVTGPTPRPSFETRSLVQAKGPDGSVYEAYCTRETSQVIVGSNQPSSAQSTRQMYGTHHGYGYTPEDVYIGKRVGNRIKTALFFPDVGSHETAPHHFAIDNKGMVHLIVADVNIYQHNRLDLYWVIGDPGTDKWTAAWLVDRRGLTSSSHPWSGAAADKVNLLWYWEKQGLDSSPDEGIFYLQWQPRGFGRKVRVVTGRVSSWDAAVDPQSGKLLLVYSDDHGVYLTLRNEGGTWTTPVSFNKSLTKPHVVSATIVSDRAFIIRTAYEATREWVVRLL
jgi:hypothetical protein